MLTTPQHEQFNRLAPALWKFLEDEIFRQVDVADLRIALKGKTMFCRVFRSSFCKATSVTGSQLGQNRRSITSLGTTLPPITNCGGIRR